MSDSTETTSRASKPLLIVLGLVVVLAALFFLVVNPRLNAEDQSGDSVPVAASQPTASTLAPEQPEPEPEAVAPEAFEIYSVRDPFEQLVQIPPVGEATPAATTSATPTGTAAGGTTGTTETAGAELTTGTPPATGGDGASNLATVSLGDITDVDGVRLAQVVVDGTSYEVGEGEVVTDALQLLALAEPCGTFQLATVQFTLCEGESIRP